MSEPAAGPSTRVAADHAFRLSRFRPLGGEPADLQPMSFLMRTARAAIRTATDALTSPETIGVISLDGRG